MTFLIPNMLFVSAVFRSAKLNFILPAIANHSPKVIQKASSLGFVKLTALCTCHPTAAPEFARNQKDFLRSKNKSEQDLRTAQVSVAL